MGPSVKTSNRLILKVEDETAANKVLQLYLRNRISFEQFEPTRPADFYTADFHTAMLRREYRAYSLGTFLRYYIYMNSNLDRIVGAVNFNLRQEGNVRFAEIGYKVDTLYQNRGIACEACLTGIAVMTDYYGIARIDARIHPDNRASVHLAEKLGFLPVRVEPKSANVKGRCVDLIRYSLRTSDTQ